jgi:hypothetical protein
MDPLISQDTDSVLKDSYSTRLIDTIDCIYHLLTDLIASDNLIIKKAQDRNDVGNTKRVIRDIHSNDLGPGDDITEIKKNEHNVTTISNSSDHFGMFDKNNPVTKNINFNSEQLLNQITYIKKLAEVIKDDGPNYLTIEKFIGDCESIEQILMYGKQEEKNTSDKELDHYALEKIRRFMNTCKKTKNNLRQFKAEINNKVQYCTESMINLIHHIGTVIDLSKNVKVKSNRVAPFIKACEETVKYLQHYEKEGRRPQKVEEVRYIIKRVNNNHVSPHHSRQPTSNCSHNSNVYSQTKSFKESHKLCKACCSEPPPDSEEEEEEEEFVLATKIHKITRVTRFVNSDGAIQENKEISMFREDPPEIEDICGFQNYNDDDYEIISERIENIDDVRGSQNYNDDDYEIITERIEEIHHPSTSHHVRTTRHHNLKFAYKERAKPLFYRPNKDNLRFDINKKAKPKSHHIIQQFTMVQPILRQCISAEICGYVSYSPSNYSIMNSFMRN